MKVKFWGVRGSTPCPGPYTIKYGGNTTCLELKFEDSDRVIIIDAGTGIRELGNYMIANNLPGSPIKTEIFLTHTHWDHIMGFPFFKPSYLPETKIKLYGPVSYEDNSLEDSVGGLLTYRYFPVRRTELASEIEYINLKEDQFDLGDGIILTTKYLNHPVLCLGYRFEYRDKVFCTAYDTEPFQNIFCTDLDDPSYNEAMAHEGDQAARAANQRVEEFTAGADLLIYDAQYTQEEYESSKVGWGHSSCEYAIAAAKRAGAKRLALFHHEPVRTDDQMDKLTEKYCSRDHSGDTEIFFAREGMEIEF